jgi:ankyrin repeat protein
MGSKVKKSLGDAAARGDADRVRNLLDDGLKVDAIIDGRYGWTALMYAAFNGQSVTTKLLIESSANVNAIDNDGNTASTLAASGNHWEVAELLAVAGADVTHPNVKGKSTLDYARHAKQKAFLKKWQPAEPSDT